MGILLDGKYRGPRRHWDLTRKPAGLLFENNSLLDTISPRNNYELFRKAKSNEQKQKAKTVFNQVEQSRKLHKIPVKFCMKITYFLANGVNVIFDSRAFRLLYNDGSVEQLCPLTLVDDVCEQQSGIGDSIRCRGHAGTALRRTLLLFSSGAGVVGS